MERIKSGEIALEYEIVGKGEPAVFIHGALIADAFRPVLAEPVLAKRDRLINYHRRGYGGGSRPPGSATVAEQAADCAALLRNLGVDRAHVVGHSYGGAVALQMALDTPGMVHSLTVLEPALMIGESADGYRQSLLHGVERFNSLGAAKAVEEFLEARSPNFRESLETLLPGAIEQAVADAGTTFEVDIRLLDWRFGDAEARSISQPVLSMLGGKSEALWSRFGEVHRWLLTTIPQAESLVIPGATHMMHLENPEVVAKGLAEFWARHPLPPSKRPT